MGLLLHQLASVAYLLAAIVAVVGFATRRPTWGRGAVAGLGIGAVIHTAAFWQLHTLDPTPQMNALPMAVSFTAWAGTGVYLALLVRFRGSGLSVVVAPMAFVGAITGWLFLQAPREATEPLDPVWSHLHVLLASAGLATLGVAAAAGLLYVIHHRAIKQKRRQASAGLPSLETLDRVNTLALALGFLLLTLGVITGVLWVRATLGTYWAGGLHANATVIAWLLYAGAVWGRFGVDVGARRTAQLSAAGFAVLALAVVGLGAVA